MRQASCLGCGKTAWVNYFTRTSIYRNGVEVPPGEYCGDCFERLRLEDLHSQHDNMRATKDEVSPGQENAIRHLEEDTGYDS